MLDLLLLPFSFAKRLLEAIKEEVDREMLNTTDSIKKRMTEMELLYSQGKISREEFEEAMEALADRLRKLEETG
jgi:Glu-tRNA(Gln) amidotransferase subunit E-like FAD-binding protein